MVRVHHRNGVVTYLFKSLAGYPLRAFVSTRHGGVSPAPWNWLNFSVNRGDTPQRVRQNHHLLAEAIGLPAAGPIRTHQVHGTGIAKVDRQSAEWQEASDALITDELYLPLALVFADCTPILLYDTRNHALAACHAGWRGTLNGIGQSTLWAMQAAYNSQPADMIACIGPSIGPDSYEVGPEVWQMAQAKLDQPERFFHFPNGNDKNPFFDLWEANVGQLIENGIPRAQIEISGIDTARRTADFFSHRAQKGRCGLFTMMTWLSDKPL